MNILKIKTQDEFDKLDKNFIEFTEIEIFGMVEVQKYFKNRLEKNKYYDLLEIMNFVVLNLPEVKKYAVWFTNPYPNIMKRCAHAQYLYKNSNNMKEFTEKLINYLEKTEDK